MLSASPGPIMYSGAAFGVAPTRFGALLVQAAKNSTSTAGIPKRVRCRNTNLSSLLQISSSTPLEQQPVCETAPEPYATENRTDALVCSCLSRDKRKRQVRAASCPANGRGARLPVLVGGSRGLEGDNY